MSGNARLVKFHARISRSMVSSGFNQLRRRDMDDVSEPSGQVLKKIYFIKKAREGEEFVTLLKNKFKTIDAIRDVLGWYREGREFAIDLTGWTEAEPNAEDERLRFEVKHRRPGEDNRSVLGAIGPIVNWLD